MLSPPGRGPSGEMRGVEELSILEPDKANKILREVTKSAVRA